MTFEESVSEKWSPWLRVCIYIFMSCSVVAATFLLMSDQLGDRSVNRIQALIEQPHKVRQEFGPRIASLFLVKSFFSVDESVMRVRLSAYFAASTALLAGLYWLISRRGAPFLLFGTFLALFYCTAPSTKDTWYPWDMPALILSALALFLALKEKILPLALLSIAAVAFKETLVLSALYIPFFTKPALKERLKWFCGCLVLGGLVRIGAEQLYGKRVRHSDFLHVQGRAEKELRIVDNLGDLFSLKVDSLLWVNAGLLIWVFFLPSTGVLRGARWLALASFVGIFFLGKVNEYRIFLELLPVSLLLAHNLFQKESPHIKMEG